MTTAGPVRAVVFDMDGTLFDSMAAVTHGFREVVLAAGGPRYTDEQIVEAFALGWAGPMLDGLLGRPHTPAQLVAYLRLLREGAAELAPYPGIVEALDELAEQAIAVAVFTGADVVSLEMLLQGTGLRDRFEVVTGGDEVERPKPAADGLLLTARRLGTQIGHIAYVGDNHTDMQAARAAGALAVGAGWGSLWRADHPADVVAQEPGELPAIVGRHG